MVAQPESVPAVRRFVDDALTTWGRVDLMDDVSLSVTELATNATLHSRSNFVDVELRSDAHVVRVAVVDTGDASAESIALRADLVPHDPDDADDPDLDLESMTGRGLFIVSSLASSWGIDDLPGGTRVWADFATGGRRREGSHEPRLSGSVRPDPRLDVDIRVIRLVGCPPDLLLAHDDNLADIARELRLCSVALVASSVTERLTSSIRSSRPHVVRASSTNRRTAGTLSGCATMRTRLSATCPRPDCTD